ncbi:extracellular calcium-sensing receptor-like [Centropristis striata]|uniref:extracellular calcium-sensing receptor-like n=1 Tax=Centropristis striata TaxID=184440 RepID=UPI0027DFD511|nr:extracellular calcium-sensing receptor-like [Centropristis striata]
MVFAVDEINRNSNLLPNVTLGYSLYDDCGELVTGFRAALVLASGQEEQFLLKENCSGTPPVVGIVGDAYSTISIAISSVLGLFRLPMVSHFATCSCLSDRQRFPSFFRTIPSDAFQVRAMIQILKHFGWTWVGLLVSDDDYGLNVARSFPSDLAQSGAGCLAYSEVLPWDSDSNKLRKIVHLIKTSTARVVMVFAHDSHMYELMEEVLKQNVTDRQWIASEAWTTATALHTAHLMPYLRGTLGIAIRRGEIAGLRDFLLQILSFDENGDVLPIHDVMNWLWLPDGRTRKKGQPECCFDCIPCSEGKISNTNDSMECTSCPEDFWSSPQRDHCVPKKTEFLSYHEPLGICLTTTSLFGTFVFVIVLVIFTYHRRTPMVRANNSELSFLLLVSLKLGFLCSLLFIGRPRLWTCQLRHAAFGISFVLCVSCILVKTMVVLAVFKASKPGGGASLKWFGAVQQRGTVLVLTSIQAAICIAWLVSASPAPHKNTQYHNDKIVYECVVGSTVGFAVLLGYIGLLAILSFLLAFLARNLPDNFNETKLITFSMLIFCAVWVAFVPAYVNSPGKYADAVEVFAILASSFGLLVALFGPKCYIILLRPERNTKKAIMGRGTAKS